ncbi:MAG: SDR family NAD(P)-dependent oxidoreductase [Paracoccaceae bacterium]
MKDAPVCLITGASGGLASGISRRLSKDGYRLVLMSRSGCAELAEELGQIGFAGSVMDDRDIANAVSFGVKRFGRIDCAVF